MASRTTFINWMADRVGLPREQAVARANAALANFIAEEAIAFTEAADDWDEPTAVEIADAAIDYAEAA